MRIAVIQASSQCARNAMLYDLTCRAARGCETVNFGCFPEEAQRYSYVEIAVEIGLLLNSGAVDFAVTGCSSGQGMMLACNSFPGVLCGYAASPQDAYLFGRINDGNAVSLPLGLNYGWAGEIALRHTLDALFEAPFGAGYPPEDAERKRTDAALLKRIRRLSQVDAVGLLEQLDREIVEKALRRRNVTDFILQHGRDAELMAWMRKNGC